MYISLFGKHIFIVKVVIFVFNKDNKKVQLIIKISWTLPYTVFRELCYFEIVGNTGIVVYEGWS